MTSSLLPAGVLLGGMLLVCLGLLAWMLLERRRERFRQEQSLDDLARFAEALTAWPSESAEIAETCYLESARRFEADIFQLGILTDHQYQTLLSIRDGTRVPDQHFQLNTDKAGIVGWIAQTGHALRVDDFSRQAHNLPAAPQHDDDHPPASAIYAPLLSGSQVVGVISVSSRRRQAFNAQDLEALRLMAMPVAYALAMQQAQARAESRIRHVTLLREVARRLTTLKPLSELMRDVAVLLRQTLDLDRVLIYERTTDSLVLRATAGDDLDEPQNIRLDEPGPVTAALHAGVIISDRYPEDIQGTPLPSAQGVAIPLGAEGASLGVLYIHCQTNAGLSSETLEIAKTVCDHLAIAMIESRNFAQQQEEAWFTTVLLEVARHAARPGDPDEALQAVLRLTTLLTGADWALLLLPTGSAGKLRMGASAGLRRLPEASTATLEVLASDLDLDSPQVESEAMRLIDLPSGLQQRIGSEQGLAFVLSDGEKLLGLMVVEALQVAANMSALLVGIARQVSLRLENAHLVEEVASRRSLEREIAMARDIQASFLPRSLPDYQGWELGVTWKLARTVGGDFYDVFPLPPGPNGPRWAIVVADVADKGVPASLFMALSRTLLRSVAISRVEPGQTLGRVNDLIIADSQADMFVAAIYAVWEPAVARLSLSNAGHQPPVLLQPGAAPQILEPHGMVLGIREAEPYPSMQVELRPGGALILYTDGVTDAVTPQGEPFGNHHLLPLLGEIQQLSAQHIADRISEAVADFGGDDGCDDDMTVLVVRRSSRPPGADAKVNGGSR
jgi:serine phosphatase RsbU (regulator of sigma subunit)/GAF domain-containing protein